MARFADAVLFRPTLGGTTDFTVSAAVQGFMTPALSGMPSGTYTYRAESQDLAQWEIGQGTYTSGTGVLTRTSVFYNSAGTGLNAGQSGAGSKINFTLAPQVGIVQITADTLGVDQSNAWSAAQKALARANISALTLSISDTPPASPVANETIWWESDTGTLYLYYNDGTSSQWVGITNNPNIAAVLFTAQVLSDAQKKQARLNIGVPAKNYIVNPAMMVSQENGTNAGTTTAYYPVDQWTCNFTTSGTISFAQVASPTPGGSPNRIRMTVTAADAAVAPGDFCFIYQHLEGFRVADLRFGSSSAKAVTLRFGVKAPAGTYCVVLENSATNRSYVAEYVISAGEANTDVVKTITVAGDQIGTWLTDNGIGLRLRFGLMCGATYQQAAGAWGTTNAIGSANQFNFMGTISNVFELFDVGLYEGAAAPDFQVPDFVSEFTLCQRYYQKSFNLATPPATNTGANGYVYGAQPGGASKGLALPGARFQVPMRAAPTTVTIYNPAAANNQARNTGTGTDWTGTTVAAAGENGFQLTGTSPAGSAAGQGVAYHYSASARL